MALTWFDAARLEAAPRAMLKDARELACVEAGRMMKKKKWQSSLMAFFARG
jgi:hypothetical protein